MKKLLGILLLVCLIISINASPCFAAISQRELNDMRNQAAQTLNEASPVDWYILYNNEKSYKGKNVKFTAAFVGRGESSTTFKDGRGNLFVIAYALPYRFKEGTNYTISATFYNMTTIDNETAAVFTYEQAHLPLMSEYGF